MEAEPLPPPAAPKKDTRWKKGQSANPKGRPKRQPGEIDVAAVCRKLTPRAIEVLEELMNHADTGAVRFRAALAIIERAYGLPIQVQTNASAEEIAHMIRMQVAAAGAVTVYEGEKTHGLE